jgi:membrane-bound lytic murein transglycosylase A
MKGRNIIYSAIIVCITLNLFYVYLYRNAEKPETYLKKEANNSPHLQFSNRNADDASSVGSSSKKLAKQKVKSKKNTIKKPNPQKIIIKNASSNKLILTKISYAELPGWDKADVKKSLSAFQLSCKTFMKQNPKHSVGTKHIIIKARDWKPACQAALKLDSISEDAAKAFFETWFYPVNFEQKKPARGLFTGYYMPQVRGSLIKTRGFTTPIYGLPKSLKLGRYTREAIDNGALKKKAPVIAWIKSPIDRLFLEIEGSGVIKLVNGERLYLGYAGENGAPYTSIGSVLIKKGIMTRNNASQSAIKRYLESHPSTAKKILYKNKSFVFFEILKKPMALGAQGIALTPGYSLAVDKKWIPLGSPLYLNVKKPEIQQNKEKNMQRLMIAQDTGGAIRGLVRGDIYWGSGKIASFLGEHMKKKGMYWLFLPKHIFNKLAG